MEKILGLQRGVQGIRVGPRVNANSDGVCMDSVRIVKFGVWGLVFLAGAVWLCGCGQRPNAETVTFSVGGAPAELDTWAAIIVDFEQETGIKVEMLRQPTDTDIRRQGLMTPLKSRKSDPDVFLLDVAWLGQFAASGWLEPLDEYIEREGVDTSAFFPKVLAQADTYQGQVVALPVYVDGGLLYYRDDLLEQYGYAGPPATWEDLETMCRKVQDGVRGGNPEFYGFVWQGAQYEGLICSWMEFAGSAGGGFVEMPGGLKVNTPANVEATRFMHGLIHTSKVSPPNTYTEMKEEQVRRFFENGNALFERNWSYAWSLHQQEGSAVKGRIGITAMPKFAGGENVSTLGGWHVGMNRYGDNKERSFALVKYVTGRVVQKKLALTIGWNPGRRDIYTDTEIAERMPHLPALREVFENLTSRPTVPYYTLISEVMQERLNQALAGSVDAQTALDTAQVRVETLTERYR